MAPVLVLTGHDSSNVDHQVMEAGAADYLVKSDLTAALLDRAVRYALRNHELAARIRAVSQSDGLTGLMNRAGFCAHADPLLKLAVRRSQPALLMFIDLDDMKSINDHYGHPAGDQALRDTARAMKDAFRETDVLARFGGDEFAALILDAGAKQAGAILSRLDEQVALIGPRFGRVYDLELSVGIAAFDPDHPDSLDELLEVADTEMYRIKRQKKKGTASDATDAVRLVPTGTAG